MNEPVSGHVLVSNRIPNAYVVCVLQHTLCRSQQRSVCLSNGRPGTQVGVPNLIFFVINRSSNYAPPFEPFLIYPADRPLLSGVSRFIGRFLDAAHRDLFADGRSEESRARRAALWRPCWFRIAAERTSCVRQAPTHTYSVAP